MQAGAIVVGTRPERSLGRREGSAGDEDTQRLVEEMWGPIDGTAVTEHRAGKGRVVWRQPLPALLQSLALPPDFEYTSRSGDAPLVDVHRRSSGDGPDKGRVLRREPAADDRGGPLDVQGVEQATRAMGPRYGRSRPMRSPCARWRLRARVSATRSIGFRVRRVSGPPAGATDHRHHQGPGHDREHDPLPFEASSSYPDVADTFTIGVWVKPENNVMLSTAGFMEHAQDSVDRWYAVCPPPGERGTVRAMSHAAWPSGVMVSLSGSTAVAFPFSGWPHQRPSPAGRTWR